jgi:hypothetical protein
VSGRGPWWAAVPGAPVDEGSHDSAAAAIVDTPEHIASVEAMRAEVIASMFIPLDDMPAEHMFRA